ncbi:Fur family transcriptional regulator [Mycobacterium montefiorense]|uniref:Transcriptional repressor n=2 Tax=Mycobacterium montefiorense TaxID=154654 RepID=A0AA37PLC4_9MYCO|nr:Fur family transcriptional regulator [Mycobacterium montefiorense]GBG36387.1 transcriptional repressor [Mycobacterium montefiorense]GKU37126.1 transcriptional repressor [Mycobacterium montefiorense]GKU43358.1 transcriptional repressor [Mycobacterium montefiorense]GKU43908.1 transcriptional repressor [Mycobacterium montefiorense]GKU53667.1 transcriptional repressor [Mycobacterium montefiorense]
MPAPRVLHRTRMTAQQRAVLDLLQRSDRFRGAQQLHLDLRQRHGVQIGLVTVYRILHLFADMEITETQRAEDGEMLYRLRTTPGHCHYLLCRRCGRAIAFTTDEIEDFTSQLAQRHRYTDIAHQIDFYGTCPRCTES